MGKLLTIRDPREDAALMAVRASRAGRGYENYVREALTELGLAAYHTAGGTVAIDPERLDALLAELRNRLSTLQVRTVDVTNVSDAAYRVTVDFAERELYNAIRRGELLYGAPTAPDGREFDPEALITRYGATGAMPRAAGAHAEEIEEGRRNAMRVMATKADAHGLCSEFEQRVTAIGLGAYLPSAPVEITTELPQWGTLTAKVKPNRLGKVEPWQIADAFQAAVSQRIRDALKNFDVKGVEGLPEGSLIQ